jgi:hypothetical protein
MGYNPAERVISNQIHLPDTRVIMSDQSRTKEFVSADTAIVSSS